MFSAFKKLTSRPDGGASSPGSVQSMSSNLQRKFAKGCNYNMKIVIRGDRNTGKSCLLARLQGKPFIEEYKPTEEIQVGSINWSYKNTEDIVKVEVWDVVDVAKKRKKLSGLKVSGDSDEYEPGLDAEFIDVYKGTHGVILLLDITKPWTMEYVRKEAALIPSNIPILILANHTDMGHHRQVSQLQVADFVENLQRVGEEVAEVRWGECSLRNGFGLKFLHRFFNVPFLTLQRQSLLQQLDVNRRDIQATQEELDVYMESEEANYQLFSDSLNNKRRAAAEQAAPTPSASIVAGQPSNTVDLTKTSAFSTPSSQLSFSNRPAATGAPSKPAASPRPVVAGSPNKKGTAANSCHIGVNGHSAKSVDVDSFVPEDVDFDNFLEDSDHNKERSNVAINNIESSDDEEGGNPMVSKYDDEIDVDNYESAVVIRDESEDSDEEQRVRNKKPTVKINGAEKKVKPVVEKSLVNPGNDLEDFLNDGDCDNSVKSVHTDYETL